MAVKDDHASNHVAEERLNDSGAEDAHMLIFERDDCTGLWIDGVQTLIAERLNDL